MTHTQFFRMMSSIFFEKVLENEDNPIPGQSRPQAPEPVDQEAEGDL